MKKKMARAKQVDKIIAATRHRNTEVIMKSIRDMDEWIRRHVLRLRFRR